MRHLTFLTVLAALLFAGLSCTPDQHIISDRNGRQQMLADFDSRQQQLPEGNLFRIFEDKASRNGQPISFLEKEALQFLYAYMPLADIADHDGTFFLENIRSSFLAREEMPWGKDIPEREFRHFVLPIRVNNEDLDNSRMIFYEELKDRVKDLSLYDAVLEINHWCHEKVIYTPSDARTSSPLASIRTAHGRCGEESTLAVAALRAMCIPARQVYTPRWAHTDDNHAWVEAWVDGKWYFLGACEPEPVLDLAWFNAPVSRGMLMHTKVFGRYDGPEEQVRSTRVFTEINVTENYAPVGRADVRITDAEGRPVQDATIEFKVYNYGEYYTVAKKTSDAEGRTFLSAGKGDMLVWASKEGAFGFQKVSFGKDQEVTIALDKQAGSVFSETLDIIPPVEHATAPEVTPEQRAENDRRFAEEDALRNDYIATFPDESVITDFAIANDLEASVCNRLIQASRGNHAEIMHFLEGLDTPEEKEGGIDLLQRIAQKDLRDTPAEVLRDHLQHHLNCSDEIEKEYLRNPRISTELLTPYNAQLLDALRKDGFDGKAPEDLEPMELARQVQENITIDTLCNMGGAPLSPAAVWKCKTADVKSRNIFFVALARTLGIPARIDAVTGKVQIFQKDAAGKWKAADIDFNKKEETIAPAGILKLEYEPTKMLDDPKYYAHFTIAKIDAEGRTRLLNYEEGEVDMGGGTTWSKVFKEGVRMDTGDYILVSGRRLANGGVLSHISSFSIREGETTVHPLVMRESDTEVQVIGSFNSEDRFTDPADQTEKSILQVCGRGYFTVGILGMGQEPTNHALRDIAAMKEEFEKWGRTLVLLFPSEEEWNQYRTSGFPDLMPSVTVCGIDDGSIQQEMAREMKFSNARSLPMFIIGDTFNRVVFASQGYTIGLGEQMIWTAKKL